MSFKDAMSLVPTSVSIVSCVENSYIYGCTISSLVSVDISEKLPEIMFVLRKNSQIGARILYLGDFSVSVFSENHQDVARRFAADRNPDMVSSPDWDVRDNRFAELKDARVIFNCSFKCKYSNHNADIYIGTVVNYAFDDTVMPLIYDGRNYKKLS
jgi:flavin reductase (DIM6/NTAB) family NADH-FMN oxidoreductase RutF